MKMLLKINIAAGFLFSCANFLSAQQPVITYGDYKIFTKDSSIQPLLPLNKGGYVPSKNYNETVTFAGNGKPSFTDGRSAVAGFNHPSGIATDKQGNVYVADEKNNAIRKISTEGIVTTIASKGFNGPCGIAVDAAGNIYVADCYNHRIKKITPAGIVTVLAGNGTPGDADNTNGLLAMFKYPVSVAIDGSGNLFVSDEGNQKIRKITQDGAVSTFAGSGTIGSADNRNGKLATFNQPNGIAIDDKGNLFVADQLNHKIRKITPAGAVSTYAGGSLAGSQNNNTPTLASFNHPRGIAADEAGNIFVADVGNQQIRKINSKGQVSTFAGSGAPGSSDNSNGLKATFYFPNSLALDTSGKLFVADCLNDRIRKIETLGYDIVPDILPEGLVFDNTTGMLSGTPVQFTEGSQYTITAYNKAGSSSTTMGIAVSSQPGNALNLDGFDDKILVPDAPMLTPPTVMVEMWVQSRTKASNIRFLLKRNDKFRYDDSYALGVDSTGHPRAVMTDGSGLDGSQVIAAAPDTLVLGRWYFLAAYFSKDSMRLYIDGQLRAKVCTGFPISRGNNALSFGFDNLSELSFDEVRIFNTDRAKELLSDMVNEISPNTPGLIAYYNCNIGRAGGQNSGYTTLYDLTANGNHGKLQNFLTLSGNTSNWVESYAMVVPVVQTATNISTNSFTARWLTPKIGVVENYYLDVSEDERFRTFVEGYQNLTVAENEKTINGLKPGTTYYYRVKANKHSVEAQGAYSGVSSLKTLR